MVVSGKGAGPGAAGRNHYNRGMPPTILLADDSPHARRMGAVYLEDLGCAPVTVADGEAALAALEAGSEQGHAPRLVLADARLPGLSGAELCRRIKARPEWRHIPCLLLVGALAQPSPEDLAAADGVLRKPLSSAGLQAWLDAALRPASPAEMLRQAVEEAAWAGLR